MRAYTYIYSSGTVPFLKELIDEMSLVFNTPVTLEDMFYYGVFCRENTYANYSHWEDVPERIETPYELTNPCSIESERIDYVKKVIKGILYGKIDKPQWMLYIEMEDECDIYGNQPSTFLYLFPKENKYAELAKKLINFLYSVNMSTAII